MSDIRICRNDGEPLVFTIEFPGAEFYCPACQSTEGVFGARAAATPALISRLAQATERYGRDRAERTGRPYDPPPITGDGTPIPTCAGCGKQPEPSTPLPGGKPSHWFARTRDGHTEYACTRDCIPRNEMVMPW